MAPTTCFVTRCSGLGPFQLVERPASIHADDDQLKTNFAGEPGLWRFNLPRQAGTTWRRSKIILKSARPPSLADSLWTPSESSLAGWTPADWNGTPPGEAARGSDAASHRRVCEPSYSIAARNHSASAVGVAPPSGHASGGTPLGPFSSGASDPESDGSSIGSALQRQALLQLLGPSTSSGHVTGRSLITGAASAIGAMLPPKPQLPAGLVALPQSDLDSRIVGKHGCVSDEGPGRLTSSSAAWERPVPLAQLQAACLASVAAALIHLPRVCGEQLPLLPSMLLRSWNPNSRLSPSGTHLATQPRQSPASAGPAAEAAARDAPGPPAACSGGSWRAGRAAKTGTLAPAALAFAAGAAATGPAAVTEASMRLLCTVEHTDSSCCGGAMSASLGTGGGGGGDSSSINTGTGGARSGRSAGGGWRRSAVPSQAPEARGSSGAVQQAGSLAAVELEKERAKEVEKPSMLDNSIRYGKLLFAGAMSAVVSRTCVAPLERVKMDLLLKNGTGDALTTAAQVLRTEGIAGFWKGNALNVLRTAPFKAVNFFSFDMYRTAFVALWGREDNTERFLAGACAGVTATLVCFPLDVVRTRLMASVAGPRYGTGPFTTLAGILKNEGAAALYSGCLPAVIGMAPAGAVFYGVYDMLKHQHLESLAMEKGAAGGGAPAQLAAPAGGAAADKGAEAAGAAVQQSLTLDPLYTLMYGAMAGAASELIIYPLEVVRRKMQLQSMALAGMRQIGGMQHHHQHHFGPGGTVSSAAAAAGGRLAAAAHHHHHMLPYHLGARKMIATLSAAAVANSPGLARVAAAVTAILSTDGPRGFYSGLLPNMLQVLPSAALSYYTYDTLKTMLGAR